MAQHYIQNTAETPDPNFEVSLRPPLFSEFAGQQKVCNRLELMVQAARQREDVLDHILSAGVTVVTIGDDAVPPEEALAAVEM